MDFYFLIIIIPEPYNVTLKDKSTNPITTGNLLSQVLKKRFVEFEKIVVLGNKKYSNIVKDIFFINRFIIN